MNRPFKVLGLGGDHIGPEVVDSRLQVLRQVARQFDVAVDIEEDLLGGASWDAHGTFCTDAVVAEARCERHIGWRCGWTGMGRHHVRWTDHRNRWADPSADRVGRVQRFEASAGGGVT
nr:isocitrate/isopropylmalate family dehydrogenase [Ruegeria sp. 6PALISEP08]